MALFNVGFVIFPDLTQLDFTGPAGSPGAAAAVGDPCRRQIRGAPVLSDCGLSVLPTHTFATCPPLDLLCVPGGRSGVVNAMGDATRSSSSVVRPRACST